VKNKEEINIIIQDCVKNQRKAQEKLFKLYYGKMIFVCLRYSPDRDTAQEIVQKGFIKVFEKISSFDLLGSFDAWIKRVMINTCIDYIRKHKKHDFVELNELNSSHIDEEIDFEIEYEIQREMALESIQELSPAYRAVFNLFFVEDYSHKEIAEKLGISEGTSKSNLSKAKLKLKEIIDKKLKKA
jgi:RNA polymerase sigma factor (sigma-70 family)